MATLIESFISKSARTMYDVLWFPRDSHRGEVFLYERTWSEDKQLYEIKRGCWRQRVANLEEAYKVIARWKSSEAWSSRAPSLTWERKVRSPGVWCATRDKFSVKVAKLPTLWAMELKVGSDAAPLTNMSFYHEIDAPELLLMVERLLLPLTHERWYNAK